MKPFNFTGLGLAAVALLAGGCTKGEQRTVEREVKQAGRTTVSVVKKGSKTVVHSLDNAADKTTDAAITGSVKTRLLADQWVGATKIDVTTKNHIVTLTGKVPSAKQRVRASNLAKNVVGVRGVVNKLGVGK